VALARLELAFYLPDPMPFVTHRNNRGHGIDADGPLLADSSLFALS